MTTLVQCIASLVFLSLFELAGLLRTLIPTSCAFWIVHSYSYFAEACFIHGVGAAFNVSLFWIEVSSGGMKIVKNIKQLKFILIFVILSLYSWLVILLTFNVGRLVKLIDIMYVVALGTSFALGGIWVSQTLLKGLRKPRFLHEVCRIQQQNAEIKRIVTNSCWIAIFCMVFIVSLGASLFASFQRIGWLGVVGATGAKLSILFIQITIHGHLEGCYLFPWTFSWLVSVIRRSNHAQVYVT